MIVGVIAMGEGPVCGGNGPTSGALFPQPAERAVTITKPTRQLTAFSITMPRTKQNRYLQLRYTKSLAARASEGHPEARIRRI